MRVVVHPFLVVRVKQKKKNVGDRYEKEQKKNIDEQHADSLHM
jgi:hypothetical protein